VRTAAARASHGRNLEAIERGHSARPNEAVSPSLTGGAAIRGKRQEAITEDGSKSGDEQVRVDRPCLHNDFFGRGRPALRFSNQRIREGRQLRE